MDEVLNKLESTAISQNDKSNFDDLYKYLGRYGGQEQRRKEILEIQKSNRFKNIDQYRGVLELVHSVGENIFKCPWNTRYRPTIQVSGFNKVAYKKVLMVSEWMTEKPSDFEENWLVVPCPKGVRTLVVATDGFTKVFTKYGHFMFQCRSLLPGGNPTDPKSKKCCCVLDCFYIKSTNVMFVIDILAWNSQPMTDGECDFRYYWLKMHLSDVPGISVHSKKNHLIFKVLQKHHCDRESFNNFMNTYPHFNPDEASLDGLLFYHKMAHYVSGESPVSVWLYPYMVHEIIGEDVTVNPVYMVEKPVNYTSQADFIKEFSLKYDKKKTKAYGSIKDINSSGQMDTTNPEDTAASSEDNKPKTENTSVFEFTNNVGNVIETEDDVKHRKKRILKHVRNLQRDKNA